MSCTNTSYHWETQNLNSNQICVCIPHQQHFILNSSDHFISLYWNLNEIVIHLTHSLMQNDLSVNLSFRRPYQSWSVKSFTSLNTSRSISSSIKNRTENHVGNDQNIMSTSLMIKLLKLLHCCIIVTDNRDRQKKNFRFINVYHWKND